MKFEYISAQVIAAAIEVHRNLGPGLLESAYEECLCHEMRLRQIQYERQKHLPVTYKGKHLECGYRIDIVAGGEILLELKCVEKLLPIHEAQILTYLKLSASKQAF
ncbi:GxxExxY protein [Geotalea toluenoxydans]|uniref:GxxExxY protein n=1 Tax=Geotalea toluenoxydans TaxID=421624 RepID=UPI000B0BC2F5|nr:GxxExxY protein [Geotalea toluenoxydans]